MLKNVLIKGSFLMGDLEGFWSMSTYQLCLFKVSITAKINYVKYLVTQNGGLVVRPGRFRNRLRITGAVLPTVGFLFPCQRKQNLKEGEKSNLKIFWCAFA
jgi:hypothetical protein